MGEQEGWGGKSSSLSLLINGSKRPRNLFRVCPCGIALTVLGSDHVSWWHVEVGSRRGKWTSCTSWPAPLPLIACCLLMLHIFVWGCNYYNFAFLFYFILFCFSCHLRLYKAHLLKLSFSLLFAGIFNHAVPSASSPHQFGASFSSSAVSSSTVLSLNPLQAVASTSSSSFPPPPI